MTTDHPIDQLRTIAEGPALDLPPVAWEPPNHISLPARTPVAGWDDHAFGGPSVHLGPAGTQYHPNPPIYIGDERMSVDQAEVAARHLLAAVAMAREVTR